MKTIGDTELNLRLVTRQGFADEFWRIVKERHASGQKYTFKGVFEELNDERFRQFGEEMFSSYSAFSMWLKRRN